MNKRGRLLGRANNKNNTEDSPRYESKKPKRDQRNPEDINYQAPIKLDKNYQDIVNQVASQAKNKKEQEVFGKILLSPNAIETYNLMRESGMSKSQIRDTYLHGFQSLARGKKPSESTLYKGIAQRLENLEGYESVVKQMYEEEILSKRDYENITSSVKSHKEKSKHATARSISKLSELEKKAKAVDVARVAVAFLFVTTGILLIFLSASPPTAAVIGAFEFPTVNVIFGLLLFVLGIVIFPKR